ncbi:MAG: aminotransferase class IV, partial [Magnetococcales bacterium]|nr:aminotransferase class IV [Magnetococcales bacterium]
GTIGLLEPGGDFTLNVAIRTLEWPGEERAVLGLGGGIVADSHWQREWRELAEKAAFLTRPPTSFHLFETLLWQGEPGYLWLEEHLQRLSSSANQLAFPLDVERAREALFSIPLSEPCVVRLALHGDGRLSVETRPLPNPQTTLQVQLAPLALDRLSHLFTHKTNRRIILDELLQQSVGQEVLFLNGDGHVACGAIRAVIACIHGRWIAPPLRCGILPSIWRQKTLQQVGGFEEEISLSQLLQASEILMGNSVRGSQPVERLLGLQQEVLWEK